MRSQRNIEVFGELSMKLTNKQYDDLDNLTGYIFSDEYDLHFEYLIEHGLKQGLISIKDLQILKENGNKAAKDRIIKKAAKNTDNDHIYAIAHRLWRDFIGGEDDEEMA